MLFISNKSLKQILIVGLVLTTPLTACTWVKKTPDSEHVRVVPADRVRDCVSLGSVTTSTLDRVTVVNRSSKKVQDELQTLAQIEASKMNGDTIVATSRIEDGRQQFGVYRCL